MFAPRTPKGLGSTSSNTRCSGITGCPEVIVVNSDSTNYASRRFKASDGYVCKSLK